jgi:hypothetical protein
VGGQPDLDGVVIARARQASGASPLHLVGHLLALALMAYAVSRVLDPRFSRGLNVVVWLVAGAIVHDLVLVPAYSGLDAVARRVARPRAGRAVSAINHLRFPAAMSGAMLLVYFPLILVRADGNYVRSTGHHVTGFAGRWLAITGALFVASGLVYLVRVRVSRARAHRPPVR